MGFKHALYCGTVAIALSCHAAAQSVNVTHLGSFPATNAAFLNLATINGAPALIISQFTGNPLAADGISAVFNIGAAVKSNVSAATVTPLTQSLVWPNDISQVTSGFGAFSGLLEAGGFLVPPKCVGGVNFVSLSTNGTVTGTAKVSRDDGNALLGGWFYHRAIPHDVDGDGFLDIIAARAIKPLFGTPAGELIWMRQPPNVPNPLDPALLPWENYTIVAGAYAPDVFSELTSLRGDDDEQIVYASFFTGGGLGILVCQGCASGVQTWSNVSALQRAMIDTTIGPGFDVQVVDLNADGRLDLLVTNHVDNVSLSGVFAYEAPAAPVPLTRASAWTKHTLYSGFIVRVPGLPGTQAAPGAAQVLPRCNGSANRKPLISVAGDGDERSYVLSPNSDDRTDWTYSLNQILDCSGTVGRQIAADTDGDGCQELFIPCYDSSTVHAFRVDA